MHWKKLRTNRTFCSFRIPKSCLIKTHKNVEIVIPKEKVWLCTCNTMAQPGYYRWIHTPCHLTLARRGRRSASFHLQTRTPSCTSSSTYVQSVHLGGLTVSPWRCGRLNSSAGWSWISFRDLQGSAAALEQAALSHTSQVSQQIAAIATRLLHITVVYRTGWVFALTELLGIHCMPSVAVPKSRYFVSSFVISRLGKSLLICLHY